MIDLVGQWVRICQECGHEQKDKQPSGNMTDGYANRKCKKCKSMSLDYGKIKVSQTEIDSWENEF